MWVRMLSGLAIDGKTSIRELAHRADASLIVVAPQVRSLILAGAVRVIVDADRALATARAGATESVPLSAAELLDVTESTAPVAPPADAPAAAPRPTYEPVPVVVAAVETLRPATDPDELARERADLASRAGLTDPGPGLVPETAPIGDDQDVPERAQIVVDRSDLLRMFSGLKE